MLIFGCSKSDGGLDESDQGKTARADYIVLQSKDDLLTPQFLIANDEDITLNLEKSALQENINPDFSVLDEFDFIQYYKDGNCYGKVISHNFDTEISKELSVFTDFKDCTLNVTAIAKSKNMLFISYEMTSTMPSTYFVRIIDLIDSESNPIDIGLEEKPVGLAVANNRLFILTFDALVSDENSLNVFDISTKNMIHEVGLGYSVERIFTNAQNNIIISYDELHTTVNAMTLAVEYTYYDSSVIAPNFSRSVSTNFDSNGKLYYPMPPGEFSSYHLVPAIYDFNEKLVVIYAYENFLSEAKRNFEYEIETTTAVGYDEKNGLMLVGYKKLNMAANAGGLLRIKIAPEPMLIDNIDLDGVPIHIIVN